MADATNTTDSTHVHAEAPPLGSTHAAIECPECFTEMQRDRDGWLARPAGARLVGLARPHLPRRHAFGYGASVMSSPDSACR